MTPTPLPPSSQPSQCPPIPTSVLEYLEETDLTDQTEFSSLSNYNEEFIISETNQETIRVASFQVGQGAGLTEEAAQYIARVILVKNIDVMVLSDCKCNQDTMKHQANLFKTLLGNTMKCLQNPVSTDPGHKGARTGGIMILIMPKWAGAIIKSYKDPSGEGIVSAVDLRADCKQVITIIGTYWAPPGTEGTEQLMARVERFCAKQPQYRHLNGIAYAQYYVEKYRAMHLDPSNIQILTGDLNVDFLTDSASYKLNQWETQTLWQLDIHNYSVANKLQIPTYFAGEVGKSTLDHILISKPILDTSMSTRDLMCRLHKFSVLHNPILRWISDHACIYADVKTYGRGTVGLQHPQCEPSIPAVPVADLPLDASADLLRTFTERMQQAYERKTWLTPTTQAEADRLHTDMCNTSFQIVSKLVKSRHHHPRQDGWSPMFTTYMSVIELCNRVLNRLRGTQCISRWEENSIADRLNLEYQQWQTVLAAMIDKYGDDMHLDEVYAKTDVQRLYQPSSCHRQYLVLTCETIRHSARKWIHGNRRRKMRERISSKMKKMERYRKSGKLAYPIKILTGKETKDYNMDYLINTDGTIDKDPSVIDYKLASHFYDWHKRRPNAVTPLSDPNVDIDQLLASKSDFIRYHQHMCIPEDVLSDIYDGILYPSQHNSANDECSYDQSTHFDAKTRLEALLGPDYNPTYETMSQLIKSRGNTSAGPTGLSYHQLKHWPESCLRLLHSCLTMTWNNQHCPEVWRYRWLKPLAKVAVDPTLDDLRPIALIEVTRKLWLALIFRSITDVWNRTHILSTQQHGIRSGVGTHTASVNPINAIEQAEESATSILLSSWDCRRAFDSVGFMIRYLAYVRSGVPAEWAKYLTDIDRLNVVMIKSPISLYNWKRRTNGVLPTDILTSPTPTPGTSYSFSFERGVGQGDTPSGRSFDTVLDILSQTKL